MDIGGPLAFYRDGTPLITPHDILENRARSAGVPREALALPETLITSFFGDVIDDLVAQTDAEAVPFGRLGAGSARVYRARSFCLGTMWVGAPAAAVFVEEAIASGVRRILVVGAAGSLSPRVRIGGLVIPRQALREEGTSYHYAPPGHSAEASPELVKALDTAARGLGGEPAVGLHWTTDAPYREHREKIAEYAERGVLSVDMEVSALYTLARVHGVEAAAILAISDTLHEEEGWAHGWGTPDVNGALALAGRAALKAAQWFAELGEGR
jgi:uridine phosphorylase